MEAAAIRRAVEIAGRIHEEAGNGSLSVIPVPEVVNHFLGVATTAVGRQLKRRALVQVAAIGGGAEKIAVGIEDHALGINPVRVATEAVQHSLRPATAAIGRHLKHRTFVLGATARGRTVEIAGGIEDQVD